ncbi:hypothetical protein RCCWILLIS_49 [Rhodobacter phage RcCWillis]|nr:hypothetical protein RCCWILLIS_49 [Rhodobacter phage RcCWillis]
MANKQLSGLTAATALDVADLFLTTQGGNSRKATGQQLIDFTQAVPERVLADLGLIGKAVFKATPALVTLNGASATVAAMIPARSIVLGVTTYVRSNLGGTLTSFDVGVAGEVNKFGGSLGLLAGSNNIGVVGPYATYADTDLVVTANGGTGTGNPDKIRLVAFYVAFNSPLD